MLSLAYLLGKFLHNQKLEDTITRSYLEYRAPPYKTVPNVSHFLQADHSELPISSMQDFFLANFIKMRSTLENKDKQKILYSVAKGNQIFMIVSIDKNQIFSN